MTGEKVIIMYTSKQNHVYFAVLLLFSELILSLLEGILSYCLESHLHTAVYHINWTVLLYPLLPQAFGLAKRREEHNTAEQIVFAHRKSKLRPSYHQLEG